MTPMTFRQVINELITLDRQRNELLFPSSPHMDFVSPEAVLRGMDSVVAEGKPANNASIREWWEQIVDIWCAVCRVHGNANTGTRDLEGDLGCWVSSGRSADVAKVQEWRDRLAECTAKADALVPTHLQE